MSSENDVEVRLTEVKALLSKSRQDLGLLDGCKFLYEQWEGEIGEKKCCPLCEKKCEDDGEAGELVKKVQFCLAKQSLSLFDGILNSFTS